MIYLSVGFTGTRHGMTAGQYKNVRESLYGIKGEFHHGDCLGADKAAHGIATRLDFKTISHPPVFERWRAFCEADEIRTPLPYTSRNRVIVNETEVLIAVPRTMEEVRKSGTWMTVRYARECRRTIWLLFPDGTTKIEHGKDSLSRRQQ